MNRYTSFPKGLLCFSAGILLAACGESTPSGDTGTNNGTPDSGVVADMGTKPDMGTQQATLTSLTIAPTTLSLMVGASQALAVTAQYSDGSSKLITTEGTFTSSDETIATVDSSGSVTAVAAGMATITVALEGQNATAQITVTGGNAPNTFVVFDDNYGMEVSFNDFGGATNSLSVDAMEAQAGSASLKIVVPSEGYTGGAMALAAGVDLSGYDALTFWAKASNSVALNVAGIQNDAADTTYAAERAAIAIDTTWKKYVIPVPNPARLTATTGLFHFAEGADEGAYTLWLDQIQYEKLGAEISNVQATIPTEMVNLSVNGTAMVGAPSYSATASGEQVTLVPAIASFDLSSSAPAIAEVAADGTITARAEGMATISAQLNGAAASGGVTVTVGAASPEIVVFDDNYGTDISFADFGGSTNMVTIDTTEFQQGTSSLRIEVPAAGYTGGALASAAPVNLTTFNAVSFWAKASSAFALNVTGLGNSGADTTYQAEYNGVPLTTTWTQFIIPIPNPASLSASQGLFHFAEGSEDGAYTIWLDNIKYVTLDSATLTNPRPAIATETISPQVGTTANVNGTSVVFAVNGTDQVTSASRAYFNYTSSNTMVATVDAAGVISALAEGTADITATLAGVAAAGTVTVTPVAATSPTAGAPAPTLPAAQVISIFSDTYPNNTVDTFSAPWDQADVADATIMGNNTKQYTNLNFAGIEFVSSQIDATAMTHFHIDIWNANSTQFRINLVDFGADGAFGGGDDVNHELTFDANSTPALQTQSWQSFDIPLTNFTNLTTRAHMAQIVIAGSNATVFVDNIYFHN